MKRRKSLLVHEKQNALRSSGRSRKYFQPDHLHSLVLPLSNLMRLATSLVRIAAHLLQVSLRMVAPRKPRRPVRPRPAKGEPPTAPRLSLQYLESLRQCRARPHGASKRTSAESTQHPAALPFFQSEHSSCDPVRARARTRRQMSTIARTRSKLARSERDWTECAVSKRLPSQCRERKPCHQRLP